MQGNFFLYYINSNRFFQQLTRWKNTVNDAITKAHASLNSIQARGPPVTVFHYREHSAPALSSKPQSLRGGLTSLWTSAVCWGKRSLPHPTDTRGRLSAASRQRSTHWSDHHDYITFCHGSYPAGHRFESYLSHTQKLETMECDLSRTNLSKFLNLWIKHEDKQL